MNPVWDGERYQSTLASQLDNVVLLDIHAEELRNFQVYYLISMLVGFFIFYLLQRFFKEQGEKQSEDFHVRGFRLVELQVLTKMQIKRAKVNRKRGYGDGTTGAAGNQ
ncbi:hypothetical protein [Vibrio sp. 10N.222.48.A11]|uniref:hypothetical protein n=1 Tax=unclassified Vibrio TaxID=2614977 RepID=UPI0038B5B76D